MNKYLTILLVLLTATGSEAQVLTSALTVGDGSMKFEEMLSPEQLRAFGSDIMSVLKGLQIKADNHNSNHPFYNHIYLSANIAANPIAQRHHTSVVWPKPKDVRLHFVGSSISIRAPSKTI